jgi:hypothetical protein
MSVMTMRPPGFSIATGIRLDIMDREAGHHQIEGGIWKRKRPHVARFDCDAFPD